MESFCGKHCEHCLSREAQGCYGCHPEYDPPGYVGCKIAQCCKTHGHVHCGTCQYRNTCHKLSCRDLMPEEKNRTLRLEAERRAELTKKCAFLGRWLWLLFWLFIPAILAWLLTQDAVRDNMSGLYWTGIVLNVALILGRLGDPVPDFPVLPALPVPHLVQFVFPWRHDSLPISSFCNLYRVAHYVAAVLCSIYDSALAEHSP